MLTFNAHLEKLILSCVMPCVLMCYVCSEMKNGKNKVKKEEHKPEQQRSQLPGPTLLRSRQLP